MSLCCIIFFYHNSDWWIWTKKLYLKSKIFSHQCGVSLVVFSAHNGSDIFFNGWQDWSAVGQLLNLKTINEDILMQQDQNMVDFCRTERIKALFAQNTTLKMHTLLQCLYFFYILYWCASYSNHVLQSETYVYIWACRVPKQGLIKYFDFNSHLNFILSPKALETCLCVLLFHNTSFTLFCKCKQNFCFKNVSKRWIYY